MENKKIHTLIACTHDGKIYSLRTNCGKPFDKYVDGLYNRYIAEGNTAHEALTKISTIYGWEYKEL